MSWLDRGNIFEDAPDGKRFYLINFKVNSAALSPGHPDYLNGKTRQLLESLPANRKWGFAIAGGASATGTASANMALSKARAQTVESFLLKNVPALKKGHIKTATLAMGQSFAEQLESAKLPPKQREEEQAFTRHVFCQLFDMTAPAPVPKPENQDDLAALFKTREFEIRQVEQITFNQGVGPGTAAVQLDIAVFFEIKDFKGTVGAYRYTGIGPALGPSILSMVANILKGKLGVEGAKTIIEMLKKVGENTAVQELIKRAAGPKVAELIAKLATASNVGKQITKGPPNKFRNRGLNPRTALNWEGQMELTQYGLLTNIPDFAPEFLQKLASATGNTILNFGGHEVIIPDMRVGYAAHVENFNSGNVTFPGILQLASSMGKLVSNGPVSD